MVKPRRVRELSAAVSTTGPTLTITETTSWRFEGLREAAIWGYGILGTAALAVATFGGSLDAESAVGLGVKGIVQNGNILAEGDIMGASHATLAAQAGVLSTAADGTLSLTGGAEGFTAFGDGSIMGSTSLGTPQVSEAGQAAVRAYYGLSTP
jgi:hypothetical protein